MPCGAVRDCSSCPGTMTCEAVHNGAPGDVHAFVCECLRPESPARLESPRRRSARGGIPTKPVKGDQTTTTTLHPPQTKRRIIVETDDDLTADAILTILSQIPKARATLDKATGGRA